MSNRHLTITIKIPERRQWRRSGVFIVNSEQIFTHCSGVPIVYFEQVNANWVKSIYASPCNDLGV